VPLGFDRAAADREDEDLLDRLRGDEASRVLVLHADTAPVARRAQDATRLVYRSPGEVPDGARWAFLGRDHAGAALLTAVWDRDAPRPFPDEDWAPLRAVGAVLDPGEAAVLTAAVSLGRWLLDADFCPACATRTRLRANGWARVCDGCGREHFPRTDPAVIVAVESATDPDLLLLGSNALWEADRFSCFAGFVEAGESAESAVVRELGEEAGVRVHDLRYRGSQAWPYPRSLMLGFLARAVDDDVARADGSEIAAVRWFTRAQIGEALQERAAGRRPGDVLLPGPASIAHRLISEWHAGVA
jgi:NAD+ diphosphatase